MATGLFNLKQVNQAISQGAWSGYIAPKWVEYLVVAGGGGASSGGAGAGGLLTGIVTVTAGASYTVTVGGGGASGITNSTAGANGVASVFGSISATGGGGSPNADTAANSGGSGSGAPSTSTSYFAGGQGVSGQGNAGASASSIASPYPASGGGGAGSVGLNSLPSNGTLGTTATAGNGGAGIASAISGTTVVYAGGGGGGLFGSGNPGVGGVGGGGSGGASGGGAGTSGGGNTGGGGGGGTGSTYAGGSGGSGIVVVRYPGSVQFYTGGTVTYSNGYIVHNFTASGTLAPTTPTVVSEYQISRSLRFNSADSPYLSRTPSTTSSQTTATFSAWVKRSRLGSAAENRMFAESTGSGAGLFWVLFTTSDQLQVLVNGSGTNITSTQVFRDPSAWYHIVAAVDTNQAIASDRIKLYVNGTQITAFTGTQTYYSLGQLVKFNVTSTTNYIGYNNSQAFDGYMTEVNWIDGQQLTPTSFGYVNPTTGIWSPAKFVGGYGTNGFYLNFSDNSNTTAATLGKDYSGNGNNWTPNNFSVTAGAGNDSLVDSPTSYGTDTGVGGTVRGNYCTWNPLNNPQSAVLTNGNLDLSTAGVTARYGTLTTIGVNSAKWYWEITAGSLSSDGYEIGIASASKSATSALGSDTESYIYLVNGDKRTNATTVAYGATYTAGDVIGVALDLDAGTLVFYKNGTSQGTAYTSIPSNTWFPTVADDNTGSTTGSSFIANFGQRPFVYTAPSGFKALCTQNLPTPTIGATTATLAGKYYDASLYTGNGSNSQVITNSGFQPDWVWIKARSNAQGSSLVDSVRGTTSILISNSTSAQLTSTVPITFNSTGFTSTTDVSTNAYTYVAWQWRAGGTAVTNTAGSITSTVSANTTSGFSVVTYTGTGANATVGHGLGVVPSMIIVKVRNTTDGWFVYNKEIGNTKYLRLNTTDAAATFNLWQSTTPTSSVFSIATDPTVNGSGNTYVAYCFAPIAGYSAFGSYTGNGSTDGPFVYTGFRPAFFLVKKSDSGSESWVIVDNARNTSNVMNNLLLPNTSGAEVTATYIDALSNGFKCRETYTSLNASGGTYIYMAFAQNPFKTSLAR